jgi:uncharacterized MAPEG superfamily protein
MPRKVALATVVALLVALAVAWGWHSSASRVSWGMAERVRADARTDIAYLGEMGGRAPAALRSVRDAYALTIAIVLVLFVLAVAGHRALAARWGTPSTGSGWGVAATTGFVIALTLTWLAVSFT